jgi:hypothetical protein
MAAIGMVVSQENQSTILEECVNETIDKIGLEVDGVILSKGRLLDCMNFNECAD